MSKVHSCHDSCYTLKERVFFFGLRVRCRVLLPSCIFAVICAYMIGVFFILILHNKRRPSLFKHIRKSNDTSETVLTTPKTNKKRTTSTHPQELWKEGIAFFACAAALAIPPVMSNTVMIFSEVVRNPLNSLLVQLGGILTHAHRPQADLILQSMFRCRNKSIFVPLGTPAAFPRLSAKIAKLYPAATRHMVTSNVEFDNRLTARTGLPALLSCESSYLFGSSVCGTIQIVGMGDLLASWAGNGAASG